MRDSSKRVPASWMAMAFPSTSFDAAEDEEEEASLLRLLLPPALILDGLMVELCCKGWFLFHCKCLCRYYLCVVCRLHPMLRGA